MGTHLNQLLASTILVVLASSANAASQLPFQVPFIFGSLAQFQEEDDALIETGAGFEIGGGMFFSRNIGIFGSICRTPSGVVLPFNVQFSDSNLGLVTLEGDFTSEPVNAVHFGAIFRRDLSKSIYGFGKAGVVYARQTVRALARTTVPIPLEFKDSSKLEATGGFGTAGVGFSLNNRFEITISFTARSAELEGDEPFVNDLTAVLPSGYSAGVLLKF